MLKVQAADISTLLEPRTATSAAAELARFPDGAALGAYGPDGRRCGCGGVTCVGWHWPKQNGERLVAVSIWSKRGYTNMASTP